MEVRDKCVLVRADFNVPLADGRVADDNRIRESLPTIEYLVQNNARIVLCSHLGRPDGKVVEELRLDPVAASLSSLLGKEVRKTDDCIGLEADDAILALEPGEVLLLENTRFHPEEKDNDPEFAGKLAEPAALFVNDAFAAAHRAHASTEGVGRQLPAVAGFLMEREFLQLTFALENPEHPFIVILGGAKVSDKIGVVERLVQMADKLLIGGLMAAVFRKAQGFDVGTPKIDEEEIREAERLLDKAGEKIMLPEDNVVVRGEKIEAGAEYKNVPVGEISADWSVADIGTGTVDRFKEELKRAKTVLWNGPLGVTEVEGFAKGTTAIARALAELDAVTIVGGGDTDSAIAKAGVKDDMTHVSTGGGAFLEFLEGKELPAIAALERT